MVKYLKFFKNDSVYKGFWKEFFMEGGEKGLFLLFIVLVGCDGSCLSFYFLDGNLVKVDDEVCRNG